MTSTLTEVDIANQALDLLDEGPITALSDTSSRAKWLNRNYGTTRDAVIRAHPWKFAIKRAALTVDGTAPTFGWSYRYALPSDLLRLLPLRDSDGNFEGIPIPHEVENGYILCEEPSTLNIRYLYRNTTTTAFDPQFVEALAAKLAFKMAHFITGKASYAQTVMAIYNQAIDEAKRSNAFEATPERPHDSDVIAARYDDTGGTTVVTWPDSEFA